MAGWPSPTPAPGAVQPQGRGRQPAVQDLEVSYRPLELRSKIQQVHLERRPSQVYEVEWPTATGEIAHLEVQIVPLVDESQVLLGASVGFSDVTRSRRYKEELEHANQGLEDAYAELQSTNEELQSTNEELETMNQEMQSTNEELQTISDELGVRTTEAQGRHFLNLDIGLPVDQVQPALRQAMSAENGSRTTIAVRGVIVVVEPQPDGQPAAE